MIFAFFGTTAEAIKLKPVLEEFNQRNIDFKLYWTGQQGTEIEALRVSGFFSFEFEYLIERRHVKPLHSPLDVIAWASKVYLIGRRYLKSTKPLRVLVHGDTFTTLIVSAFSRVQGVPVIHLEAGYRSYNWKSPFPEELIRRLVRYLATYHLPPTQKEANNLLKEGVRKEFIHSTGRNTAVDNLTSLEINTNSIEPYGVVTLHRSELIEKKDQLLEVLLLISRHLPAGRNIYLVADSRTNQKVSQVKFPKTFRLNVIPKMVYPLFMEFVAGSEFVITDSGGLQQELALLGIPTLIHRKSTETSDGLNSNILLDELNNEKLIEFLGNYNSLRMPKVLLNESPSASVADAILMWDQDGE